MHTQPSKTYGNAAQTVLRGKFTAIKAYLRKQEKWSSNLTLHLKQPGKEHPDLDPTHQDGRRSACVI